MGAYYSTDLGLEERKKYLNWKPSKIDTRDVIYRPQYRGVLPKSVDLRSNMPKVYDQGKLSSCTANSISAAYEYMEHPRNDWMPSRLFLYYNEREIEGTTDEDSGAHNRDGIKSLAKKESALNLIGLMTFPSSLKNHQRSAMIMQLITKFSPTNALMM